MYVIVYAFTEMDAFDIFKRLLASDILNTCLNQLLKVKNGKHLNKV